VTDAGSLVLRPDVRSVVREGKRTLAARLVLARLLGRLDRFNSTVFEPNFKPVHWLVCGRTPLGYTNRDLLRLGELGAALLERAGVGPDDVLVSVLPGGATVAHWQLVQGARRRRVPAAHVGPHATAADIEALCPTVIAGHPEDLSALRGDGRFAHLRTVLCVGRGVAPSSAQLSELSELGGTAPIVASWAPPGARALWGECREHASADPRDSVLLHLDRGSEVAEVLDGELLWTGVGWHGSALLRVRTGAGVVLVDACPACGRAGQVVRPAASVAAALLESDPEVVDYSLEERTVDGEPQLIVHLRLGAGADPARVVPRLDARLQATQYILLGGGPGQA
jgi:hypothetical protein